MNDTAASATPRADRIDWLTLAALAALAYVLATALHEHAGHAVACIALGGKVRAFGAFYVDCDYRAMGAAGIRLIALAGPLVSLLLGLLCARLLRGARTPWMHLFWWAMASIGLMTAFGYLMFSAVSDLGDFGTGADGAFHGLPMPWLWRIAMGGVGYWLYDRSVVWSMRTLAAAAGGRQNRPQRVQRIALLCYLAGAATCIGIGLFNPEGFVILLTSAAAASLGGTSGFAWGPARTRVGAGETDPTPYPRSWAWIIVGAALVLAYGVLLGPSIVR